MEVGNCLNFLLLPAGNCFDLRQGITSSYTAAKLDEPHNQRLDVCGKKKNNESEDRTKQGSTAFTLNIRWPTGFVAH
jgi:hypothetical protein